MRGSSSSTALYAQPDESWASYHDTKSPLPSISLRGISISLPGETEKATRTALNAAGAIPAAPRGAGTALPSPAPRPAELRTKAKDALPIDGPTPGSSTLRAAAE